MITLKWHETVPEDINLDELELEVLKDIKQSLSGLEFPSDLIFHTVFLGSDYNGPHVTVWGEAGDNSHFHCEYCEKSEWVSLNEEEEEDNDV